MPPYPGRWKEGADLPDFFPLPRLSSSFSSVATRIEQRKKMNCKSFRWYLDNVYPELT